MSLLIRLGWKMGNFLNAELHTRSNEISTAVSFLIYEQASWNTSVEKGFWKHLLLKVMFL